MPILGSLAGASARGLGGLRTFGAAAAVDTGAMFPIGMVSVGSAGASTISFSSIPSTYKHLQIRGIHRVTGAYQVGNCFMRVGAGSIDTGNNYSNHTIVGDGSTAAAAGGGGTRSSMMGFDYYNSVGANATSGIFSTCIIDILDYANTSKYKTVRFLMGREMNSGNTDSRIYFESGLWQSTSAISNIQFTPLNGAGGSADFVQYSQFALYGIKGA